MLTDGSAEADREIWIDCQLTASFISNINTSALGFAVALLGTAAVLFGHVPNLWLIPWAATILALLTHRYWMSNNLKKAAWQQNPASYLRRFKKQTWSWPLSSGAWGSSVFFYVHHVPIESQFISLAVLVGIGSFAVPMLSDRLDVFKLYVDSLVGAALLAYVAHASFQGHGFENVHDIALLALILVFWRLMRVSGARYHTHARHSFGLQYDNDILIASLRKQSSAAFEAVDVKDRLLANAAHDLRQPIHALAFYAELLRGEPREAQDLVPKILSATDSVNNLFNSLFDFAKIESNGIELNKRVVPVCEIISSMMLQFAPAAQAKNLDFRHRIEPAYVETDPLLMQRILGNFLSNAIRYTDAGGVLLSSRVREGKAWIEVYDTGPGIAPEHLPYVFREFYKVPKLGTEEGFGLGLAIAQRLADALGHKIDVRSRLGRGTRFCLKIPIVQMRPEANQGLVQEAPKQAR